MSKIIITSKLFFRDQPCPYHDCAVLGATSDDVVIMRTPVDVQHRARVTTYCRVDLVYTASLRDGRQLLLQRSYRVRAAEEQRRSGSWYLSERYENDQFDYLVLCRCESFAWLRLMTHHAATSPHVSSSWPKKQANKTQSLDNVCYDLFFLLSWWTSICDIYNNKSMNPGADNSGTAAPIPSVSIMCSMRQL